MKVKQQFIKGLVNKVSKTKDGFLEGVVGSTSTPNRNGFITEQTWKLANFRKNPVILWAHNLSFGEERPPIGKATKVWVEDDQLRFNIQFDMEDPFAAGIFRKYKQKFLNAFSVGFMPGKVIRRNEEDEWLDYPILKDNELWELSAVPVPADPKALNKLKAQSFAVRDWETMLSEAEKNQKCHNLALSKSKSKKKLGITKDTPAKDRKSKAETASPTTPTNPKLEARSHLVSVVREANRQLQEALRVVNAEMKALETPGGTETDP